MAVKGEDITITITLRDETTGDIFDLVSVTTLDVSFPNESDGCVKKTLSDGVTITDAANGKYTVALTATDSATLKDDANFISFESLIVKSGVTRIIQHIRQLKIADKICP